MQPRLRLATPKDAPGCLAIYAPIVRQSPASFEVEVPSVEEFARRMHDGAGYPWIVALRSEVVVGYAYGGTHRARPAYRWSAEVSAYVAADSHRQGIGRRLYGALFECLCALNFRNAFAGVTLPNDPSVALHEAMGFSPIGVYPRIGFKFDRWHDVGWWGRRLGDDEGPPQPLRRADECAEEMNAIVERY